MLDLIIIRGASGVGKSTLSKKLIPYLKNGVTIEVGTFLKMINDFEDGNSEQYAITLDNIVTLSLEYISKCYQPVLIIGPMKGARITKHFLPRLSKDVQYIIITLLADEQDIYSRIDRREIGYKNKKSAKLVNDDLWMHTFPDELRFNTAGKNANEVFMEVWEVLKYKI